MRKRFNYIQQIIYVYIGFIFLCISCQLDYSIDEMSSEESAIVHLQIKSEINAGFNIGSMNENSINDLHILIYNNRGELIGQKYTTNSIVSISTRRATGCTIYAIANTGNRNLFKDYDIHSEIYLKNMTYSVSAWNELTKKKVLPMSGSIKDITITEGVNSFLEVTVKRMIAKITLNVEAALGSGIIITDYRIYSIPKQTYYVLRPLNTETSIEDIGTRANDASLPEKTADWIESGKIPTSTQFSTTFYMFENRAGINNSILQQQDKNQINAPDSATYIMISGKAPGYQYLTWKIYLGATNTTNFNIKRNCTYTYNITLKPTINDTRVSYIKSGNIWAGSNIYWDGSKLTFDEVPTSNSELKQGIYFRWGSLIGLSPTGSDIPDAYYIPIYDASAPVNSKWQTYQSYPWSSIYCFLNEDLGNSSDDRTDTFLNDAARNTDTFYHEYKGDICQYLSRTNAVKGNWRMPTSEEFGETSQYSSTGSYNEISNTNSDGTYIIPVYKSYKLNNGDIIKFPISGLRESDGKMNSTGKWGYYWSCSKHSGSTSFHTWLYNDNARPISYSNRSYGFTIRCVQN